VKLRQVLLAAALVSLAAVTVHADDIPADGRIIVGHGSDPAPPETCGQLDFKIHLNGSGGGIKNCINTSGVDWIGLEIIATIPLGDTVHCVTPTSMDVDSSKAVFSNPCSNFTILSTFDHKENIEIILSGGGEITTGSASTSCTTVPTPPSCFYINLNTSGSSNPNASGGWFALLGGNLDVHAIPTPEPVTILLFVSGLGVLCLRRRLAR
jgi:hypothetical protein